MRSITNMKAKAVAMALTGVMGLTGIGVAISPIAAYAGVGDGIYGSGSSSLGDLFVLTRLFKNANSGVLGSGDRSVGLGDLFIYEQLFNANTGGGSSISGSGSGNRSLGDLFILDRLFAGQSSGILQNNGGQTSLGNLFILDQVFR